MKQRLSNMKEFNLTLKCFKNQEFIVVYQKFKKIMKNQKKKQTKYIKLNVLKLFIEYKSEDNEEDNLD